MEMMNSESKSVRNLECLRVYPSWKGWKETVWSATLSAQPNQKKEPWRDPTEWKSAEATGHTDTVPSLWCPERRKMLPPTWLVQSGKH